MKIHFNKKVFKDRKQSLCYWGINLSIAIIATISNNGLYNLFLNRMNMFRNSTEWIFWISMGILVTIYIVWCITVLLGDLKSILSLNDKILDDADSLSILRTILKLPKREEAFLQKIKTTSKIKKIAIAITLKDYVKERNESICHFELNAYIPTYRHIISETDISLHALVSALSLMSKYESDKYYNSKLIIHVGNDIIQELQ